MLEQILTVGEFKGRVVTQITSLKKSFLEEHQNDSEKLERFVEDYNWGSFVYASLLGFEHEESSKFIKEQEYVHDCHFPLGDVVGWHGIHNEKLKKYGKDIPPHIDWLLEYFKVNMVAERIGNLPSHSRMFSDSVKKMASSFIDGKDDEKLLEHAYEWYNKVYEKCRYLLNKYGNADNIITTGLENLTPAELGIFKGIFEKKISNNQAPL